MCSAGGLSENIPKEIIAEGDKKTSIPTTSTIYRIEFAIRNSLQGNET